MCSLFIFPLRIILLEKKSIVKIFFLKIDGQKTVLRLLVIVLSILSTP